MSSPRHLLLAFLFGGFALGGLRGPWVFALLGAALWSTALKAPPHHKRVPARPWWVAWLLWSLVSALLSAEPLTGLAAFTRSATGVVFFALAASYWDRESKRAWFHALCATGLVLGLTALLITDPSRPMIGILYPYYNYMAALQAAVFAACLGAWGAGYPRSRKGKAALSVLMIFNLSIIFMAHSRGAQAAALAAVALWLWRNGRKLLLAGALCAGVAFFSFAPIRVLTPLLKLDHRAAFTRTAIWRSTGEIIRDHPWFGQGPGQYLRGFLRHNFPVPAGHRPARYGFRSTHAHCEPLQLAAETGLPGLGLFLAALLLTWRRARREGADWSEEAAVSALAALFAHGLIDNILAMPSLQWLFFSALAVCSTRGHATVPSSGPRPNTLSKRTRRPRPPAGNHAPCVLHAGAAGFVLTALSWWPSWALNTRHAEALRAGGPGGVALMLSALKIAPDNAALWEDLARLRLRAGGPHAHRDALLALGKAAAREPTNAVYAAWTADIFRHDGLWPPALTYAEAAIELEPGFLWARLIRAETLLRLGRKADARAEMKAARALTIRAAHPEHPFDTRSYEDMIRYYALDRAPRVEKLLRAP